MSLDVFPGSVSEKSVRMLLVKRQDRRVVRSPGRGLSPDPVANPVRNINLIRLTAAVERLTDLLVCLRQTPSGELYGNGV
jgi:hypothetical protein